MAKLSGLTVRQHERTEFELPAELVIADEHRAQVRFSSTSPAAEPHVIAARTIDISPGGMGLTVRQFLPRMCEGAVRLFDPAPIGMRSDGTPIRAVAFEHRVKVRRVRMSSHDPVYMVGLSFIDPEPDLEQRVAALQARVRDPAAAAGSGGPGAIGGGALTPGSKGGGHAEP
jgi:hypothetical protein